MRTTIASSKLSPLHVGFFHNCHLSKRHKLRCHRLNRRRRSSNEHARDKKKRVVNAKAEMEIKNLKLYMENKSITEENEKLRRKALLLHQENQNLLLQLQKKYSNINPQQA